MTTSDGRQSTLSLDPDTTYFDLKVQIKEKLNISEEEWSGIKYGFPPKVLEAPLEGENHVRLPLQHGDRITVVITKTQGTKNDSCIRNIVYEYTVFWIRIFLQHPG